MTPREVFAELMGSEDKLDVLFDIAAGTFPNGEAAESRRVHEGTITRTRQKAEALVVEIHSAWQRLDESLHRLRTEVLNLPDKVSRQLRDLRREAPDEYGRLRKKHVKLFRALEELRDTETDSSAAGERAWKKYEDLHRELGRLEVDEISGVDLGNVRRLYGEVSAQTEAIQAGWRKLSDLLGRLNYHEIRDINLNELRRLTEDGLGLLEVSLAKLHTVLSLLGKSQTP